MNPQTIKSPSPNDSDVLPGTNLEGYNEGDAPPALESQTLPAHPPPKTSIRHAFVPVIILAAFIVLGFIAFILLGSTRQMTPTEVQKFNQQAIELDTIAKPINATTSGQLAVNGGLSVSGSFQVAPNDKPLDPTIGQIFYDKERNALGYYNGSEFVYMQGGSTPIQNIDNSVSTTTIVNNAIQLAPPSILLQQGTPTTTQSGSFNVNGTGIVGSLTSDDASITIGNITNLMSDSAGISTLNNNLANIQTGNLDIANVDVGNINTANINLVNTSQIESNGQSITINKFEEIPGGQAATAGYTSIGSSTTRPVGMFGTKVTTGSSGGPLDSVSVYIGGACQLNTISGCSGPATNANFEIGIYSDDGDLVSNKPQTLLTQAGPFYANDGDFTLNSWNTLNMPNLPLQPFTSYWVVFLVPGNWQSYGAIDFRYKTNTSDGNSYTVTDQSWCTISPGSLPANGPLPTCFGGTGPYYSKQNLSAYLNYTTDPSTGGAGAMFSLSPTGQASFRATEDSLNAFKIQNAASATTIFNVDTYNMRVAIGKPNADYLLDIGNGDINMVSGRSLRFNGTKVLTATSTSTLIEGTTITLQGNSSFTGAATFASTTAHTGAATFASTSTFGGAVTINNTLLNRVNSATAFRVQNTANTDLFLANTSSMTVTVGGTDTTFATLTLNNSHFRVTQTSAPTIGTPSSCGVGSSASVAAGSTDAAGSFTITTGNDGTSSTCNITLTFRRPYGAAPKSIIVVGKGSAAAAQRGIYVASASTTNFSTAFANSAAGANNTAYEFNYWIIE
jgi:hypothetical protein